MVLCTKLHVYYALLTFELHYSDDIMSIMASQITGVSIVCSTVCSSPGVEFKRRSKKTSKLRATGLCKRNPPVTGGFLSQRASNVENVSMLLLATFYDVKQDPVFCIFGQHACVGGRLAGLWSPNMAPFGKWAEGLVSLTVSVE